MATFTVTTIQDEDDAGATAANPGGTGLSLREALVLANNSAGADTIEFASDIGETFENGGTITLMGEQLVLSSDVTIDGDVDDDGRADVTLDGAGASRILGHETGTAVLDGVNLVNGYAPGPLGTGPTNAGGAVYSSGATFAFHNATISGNTATYGGAILAFSNLLMENATVTGNTTRAGGFLDGTISVVGTVSLTNVTVEGNTTAGPGGALYLEGTGNLQNVTITGNTAGTGPGGIFLYDSGTTTVLNISDSIVAGNSGQQIGQSGSSTINNANSIVDVTDPATLFAAIDPSTGGGLLADNGGRVQTVALLNDPTNPAIDAGSASSTTEDARGRLAGDDPDVANTGASVRDLGAFELSEVRSLTVTTLEDVVDATDGVTSIREAISFAQSEANADTITFDASLSGGTLVLTQGSLEVTDSDGVTIDGQGISISGNGASRIFEITGAGTSVELRSLDLTNGFTSANRGGAVFADADTNVTVVNSTIRDSESSLAAGGMVTYGTATVVNSLFTGNTSMYNSAFEVAGPGVSPGGALINVTVTGNIETGGLGLNGVGAYSGSLTVSNSTLQGDRVLFGTVTVVNSIVDGLTLSASGMAYNSVFRDGGLTGSGNLTNVADFGLGPLADNGGPTLTLAPQAGSVVIGAGDSARLPLDLADADGDGDRSETLPIDAAGGLRLVGGSLDAGAVEVAVIAEDDAFTTDEDTAIGAGLNLFDANPGQADIASGTGPREITAVNGNTANVGTEITLLSGALLTVYADGTFSYDPNGAFEGLSGPGGTMVQDTDSFTYTLNGFDTATVVVTVDGVNDAPVATGETLAATDEDTATNFAAADLLGNDTDVDGDTLTIASVTSGAGGTAVLNA
ncbi:VCBS repeat-containing protein, partial [Roseivivax marinus]